MSGRSLSHDGPARHRACSGGFFYRWLMANTLLAGLFALIWLMLRSGTKPSRFAYPCQQAAISAATLAFGVPIVSSVLAARRQVVSALRTRVGLGLAAIGLACTCGSWLYVASAEVRPARATASRGYVADVFHVGHCPQDPVGNRFVGLENLVGLMGDEGLKLYQSLTPSTLSGPQGLIGANDVVLIKINYQWGERGGTNTDVLRGLVDLIVHHPDGFIGEIVIVENTQFVSGVSDFDRTNNNAQIVALSPGDIVDDYRSAGYMISHYAWTDVRGTEVGEYEDGDMADGYVVYEYEPTMQGAVSYPKFQSYYGTYVSLRNGVWDTRNGVYNREQFAFVNLPVLKSHATYGITGCVKNHMGTITTLLGTNGHYAMRYGLLGAMLGEIGMADLNILDCIWVNAIPGAGPWTSYDQATRRDILVASVDPVAADMWAASQILIPAFVENGHTPPFDKADPEDPDSDFRQYLDNAMAQIQAHGFAVSNDLETIDVHCTCPVDCGLPLGVEGVGDTCSDMLDNDCDGLVDEDDAGCHAVCGNGILEGSEECDDGNTVDGDRCSSACMSETPPCTSDADCVMANDDCCGFDACDTDAGFCHFAVPVMFGDVCGRELALPPNGTVNLTDVVCALDAFGGDNYGNCPNADVAVVDSFACPHGNGLVDLTDLLRILDAFGAPAVPSASLFCDCPANP